MRFVTRCLNHEVVLFIPRILRPEEFRLSDYCVFLKWLCEHIDRESHGISCTDDMRNFIGSYLGYDILVFNVKNFEPKYVLPVALH